MNNIDLVDRKLLLELDSNCRQSIKAIAKKLRISRTVVIYRIDRLKQQGIIRGSFAEINNQALGYLNFRIFLKVGNYDMQQYGTLLKYLSSTKEMIWGFRVLGRWDLDFVFAAKSVLELDSFKNALLLKFNSIIEDYDIALVTHSYIYPRDYLVGARIKVIRKLLEPKEAMRLEDSDMRLIKCLSADAMMHIIDISKKTRLAINTVKRRMRYLESKNIILGYRIFIDTNKLGYNYYKLHLGLRRYTVQDVNKLQTFLEYKESVVFIDKSLGGDDLEVEIHLKSENEYASFLEELLNNFSAIIKDHFVIRFYEELVFRYMPGE